MKIFIIFAAATLFIGCSKKDKDYDATGTFEATEVTVSAEQTGKLMMFDINEGDNIKAGKQIGLIDTVQLYLKAQQIRSTKFVYSAQKPEIQKQIGTIRQQITKARQEVNRYTQLVNENAANRKLLDDTKSQLQILESQLEAQTSSLNTSTNSLNAQMNAIDIEKLLIADQLQKCYILSPISGTVLDKYVEKGEFVTIGKPLFKIADIYNMFLRAYITSAQLRSVKIGQHVKVFSDYGGSNRKEYKGTVTWISSKSEFTPKTILTNDERADLVYAIKIAIKNDSYIKIGMYGEVKL